MNRLAARLMGQATTGWRWVLAPLLVAQLGLAGAAAAEEAAPSFRELKIVVGAGAGGGYDIYVRLVARHFGRFVPGGPRVVVVNMPGANSMTAAAHMAGSAKKDGSEMLLATQPLILTQLFNKPGVRFDLKQFRWIGNLSGSNTVTLVRSDAGINSIDDARRREVTMGSASPGSLGGMYPLLMNKTLGTRFRVINGYNAGEAIDLALERGEVQGRSGVSWSTVKSLRQDWLRAGTVKLLVQVGAARSPELPDTPLLVELARSAEDRAVITMLSSLNAFTRAFMTPPGVPEEAVRALREAFDRMIADPEFLRDAEKAKLEIDPMRGEEVQQAAQSLFELPDHVVARAKEIADVE